MHFSKSTAALLKSHILLLSAFLMWFLRLRWTYCFSTQFIPSNSLERMKGTEVTRVSLSLEADATAQIFSNNYLQSLYHITLTNWIHLEITRKRIFQILQMLRLYWITSHHDTLWNYVLIIVLNKITYVPSKFSIF